MPLLPDHITGRRHRAQALALAETAVASIGGVPIPRVSLRNGQFVLTDAKGNRQQIQTLYLDGIIVNANPHQSKVYYKDDFNPEANSWKPPDCWSDDGVEPSPMVAEPVSPKCLGCPKNQFTTPSKRQSPTGKPIMTKACGDKKKLAVIFPISGINTPFQMILPQPSHRNFKEYCGEVSAVRFDDGSGLALSDIVTRFSFDPNAKFGTLLFEGQQYITAEEAEAVDDAIDSGIDQVLIGTSTDTKALTYQSVETIAAPTAAQAEPAASPGPGAFSQVSGLAGAHPGADEAGRLALEAEAARVAAERAAQAAAAAVAAANAPAPETGPKRPGRPPKQSPAQGAPPPAEARPVPFGNQQGAQGSSGGAAPSSLLSPGTKSALAAQLGQKFGAGRK